MTDGNWYARWFGDEYLRLYPHRDQEEADRAVALLAAHLPPLGGARLLDLACGAGRHLLALRGSGIQAFGLDLSFPLLLRAREAVPGAPLVRADMRRIPFAEGTFTAVTSFFTSFGYFTSSEQDRAVLGEIRRVLEPGGHLLLDFLNADRVRERLSPRDERTVGGRRVVQERRLLDEGRTVEKTIRIETPEGGLETFVERVRLYGSEELRELLVTVGFRPGPSFGSYDGTPFGPDSARFILLAHLHG